MNAPARLLRVLALAVAPLCAALPAPAAAHSRADLEQMLAPIALYPDSVLSHVLIAATYPEEVAEAARWSRRHPDLHGEDAVDAVERRDWDPSVKALVAFPDILARMDEDPDWTEDLGAAFLEHEAEVMDSVQVLRDHAYDAGHLRTTEHVRVIREREYIYIEPAVHHIVYVPYYDPWAVYGTWWWPSHPPYRWRHWHGHAASYYGSGFYWGLGFRIAPTFYFTSFYWPERYVVVTHYRNAGYRPLYSGRDVVRHQEVRHWRAERPASAERHPRTQSRAGAAPGERRVERGGRPERPDRDERPRDERRSLAAPQREPRRPPSSRAERGGDDQVAVPRGRSRDEPTARGRRNVPAAPREAPREAPRAEPREDQRSAPRGRAPEEPQERREEERRAEPDDGERGHSGASRGNRPARDSNGRRDERADKRRQEDRRGRP